MLDLDGSAGGGQLVRSALTLSALTGTAFRMTGVRESRAEPGLRPQHLAGVELAARVCGADVEGAAVGADEFSFDPGTVRGGHYEIDVGTAGSVTLLFDILLPLARRLDDPLSASITGGTDVKWSPTAAYHAAVKLPPLRRRGLQAAVDVERTGFYPAGGGEARLSLAPSRLDRLDLGERGALRGVRVYSKASTGLADAEVAERQAAAAAAAVEDALAAGESESIVVERSATYVATDSPGSALAIRADYERSTAGFDALGERGVSSEAVAAAVAEAAIEFHAGEAAVDERAADQLLIPLALAGGRLSVPRVTDHVATSLDLLAAFGFDLRVVEEGDGGALIERGE